MIQMEKRCVMAHFLSTAAGLWPIFKPLLFQCDPEWAHEKVMYWLELYGKFLPKSQPPANDQAKEILGLRFPNCVGLAAGFDKNARCLRTWQELGFGFVEVGTVTFEAQEGNTKPRLFRFPEQKSLLNRMGFNNDGARVIAERIAKQRSRGSLHIPIGINIGKSRIVDLAEAAQDYLRSFLVLADLADYMTINVSSPNTPGLRDLQAVEPLQRILEALCLANQQRQKAVPLFLKISPDLSHEAAKQVAQLALDFALSGLVLSNTSIDFSILPQAAPFGAGGLSGAVLFAKSTALQQALFGKFQSKLVFIASGGIDSAIQAQQKIAAGAQLLQIYSGFVFNGPAFPRQLVKALSA